VKAVPEKTAGLARIVPPGKPGRWVARFVSMMADGEGEFVHGEPKNLLKFGGVEVRALPSLRVGYRWEQCSEQKDERRYEMESFARARPLEKNPKVSRVRKPAVATEIEAHRKLPTLQALARPWQGSIVLMTPIQLKI
jgi:hypothetical protein